MNSRRPKDQVSGFSQRGLWATTPVGSHAQRWHWAIVNCWRRARAKTPAGPSDGDQGSGTEPVFGDPDRQRTTLPKAQVTPRRRLGRRGGDYVPRLWGGSFSLGHRALWWRRT